MLLPRSFFYTLLSITATLRGAILLRYNFETENPWMGMTGYFQSAGGTRTSTPTVTTVGDTVTVSDPASINQPRRFLRLRVTEP